MQVEFKKNRIISIDFMRGLTVAFMIFVNSPGSWEYVYPWFAHSRWNGCTPTDLVFPFFLFIAGLSVFFSSSIRKGQTNHAIVLKLIRRATLLFLIGLLLNGFPLYHLSNYRIPGVLQRISIVFFACAILNHYTSKAVQFLLVIVLLIGYWLLICFVKPPGADAVSLEPIGNLSAWIDTCILKNHVWVQTSPWDPEGVLSTLPAITTGLIGLLTGVLLQQIREKKINLHVLFISGVVLIVSGFCWNGTFPINKNLWSSSYVLFTAGIAQLIVGISYWLIDEKGYKKFTTVFFAFGTNAITAYVLSELLEAGWNNIVVNEHCSLKAWIYDHLFACWLDPYWASHLMAIAFTCIIYIPVYCMYKKNIRIKIG